MNVSAWVEPERRRRLRQALRHDQHWDLIIVGGGCVGAGLLLEAALRGYRALLLERDDFAEGTSSRSSKLLHGGVRYLRQGNFPLVKEALRERAIVLRNAPHVARPSRFVMPARSLGEALFYRCGLALYDALAGAENIGKAELLGETALHSALPLLKATPYRHGVGYYDGIFDDALLVLSIIRTARHYGGEAINHCAVSRCQDTPSGHSVVAVDAIGGETLTLTADCLIEATGPWSGQLDSVTTSHNVAASRGSHLVIDDLGLSSALVQPQTPDGRVLFFIPWRGKTLIGTTDVASPEVARCPLPPTDDIRWLLTTASQFLARPIDSEDIRAVFCGYRPLVSRAAHRSRSSAALSREHHIERCGKKRLRIIGGKWTTYRKMAEDALNTAIHHKLLLAKSSANSADVPLLAYPALDTWQYEDAPSDQLIRAAIEDSDACTVDDVISRRLRASITHATSLAPLANQVIDTMAQYGQWHDPQKREAAASWQMALQQYLPRLDG